MAVRGTRQYVDVLAPGVGLARTSRQYIDILAPGDGALRTSRQYVDILRVYDDFSAEVYNITILDFLNLSSVVDLVFGTIIEEVEDIIYFYDGDVQLVATEYIITVTSDLGLLSPGVASPLLENEMVLVSTVIAGVGEVVESELGLEHQVVTLGIFSETVTHTLNLNSTCTFYPVSDQRFDRQYYPFIGGATTNITPPSTLLTGPMSGITAPFQFVYPATGEVTDSVTLRAPEFGNKDRLTFNRVNRETRGGSLVVFANPTWPKIQTLVLSFTGLKQLEVQDLFDFITDYLGQEIGLIDWESRYWVGVITNPNESATEDSDNNFSINLEFEGELDEDWSP